MYTFSATQQITNSGSNRAQADFSLGWHISKNKCILLQTNQPISMYRISTIYFNFSFHFKEVCIIVLWSKMIDSTFFLLKFLRLMLLSITLQWHNLLKVKEAYYKTLIECTWWYQNICTWTNFSQMPCTNKRKSGFLHE